MAALGATLLAVARWRAEGRRLAQSKMDHQGEEMQRSAMLTALPKRLHDPATGAPPQPDECCICLESYAAGDALISLPCGHDFHLHCVTPWLLGSTCNMATPAACPWCKVRLVLPAPVPSVCTPSPPQRTRTRVVPRLWASSTAVSPVVPPTPATPQIMPISPSRSEAPPAEIQMEPVTYLRGTLPNATEDGQRGQHSELVMDDAPIAVASALDEAAAPDDSQRSWLDGLVGLFSPSTQPAETTASPGAGHRPEEHQLQGAGGASHQISPS